MTVKVRQAASLVIVDDKPDLHVLVGRRRMDLMFAPGLVVFPGGAVEDSDESTLAAALRETGEETGWWPPVPPSTDETPRFPYIAHWITPRGSPRRYDTHFYLARFTGGALQADVHEFDDLFWDRPAVVLKRIEADELLAITPTLSILSSLARYRDSESAFDGTRRSIVRRFAWGETWF